MINLVDSSELLGAWHVGDDTKSREAGVLKLDPHSGAKLTLHRADRFDETIKMILSSNVSNPNVTGQLADGRNILLHNCLPGETRASMGASVVSIKPQLVKIGALQHDPNEKNIRSIRISIPAISTILDLPNISTRISNSTIDDGSGNSRFFSMDQKIFEGDKYSIIIQSSLERSFNNGINLSSSDKIVFNLVNDISFKESINIVRCFADFLFVLTGEWLMYSTLELLAAGVWVDVWFQHVFLEHAKFTNISIDKLIRLSVGDIQNRFSAWIGLYDRIERALSLMRISQSNNVSMIDNRFLLAAQASETFHRALYHGSYIDSAAFNDLKCELQKTIQPILARVLNERLRQRLKAPFDFSNEFSLKDRLTELAAGGEILGKIVDRIGINSIDKLRNALSHGRHHGKSGEQIYSVFLLTSCIIEYNIIIRLGIEPENAEKSIARRYAILLS